MLSTSVALVCRLAIPGHGNRMVLRDTLAILVHDPEIVLRLGVALVCRLPMPDHCSRMVLRDTLAIVVHDPESALSIRVTLFCCLAKPGQRRRVIPRDVAAEPKFALGTGVSLVRRLAIPEHCSRIVLFNTFAILIHDPEIVLSMSVALFCCVPVPSPGGMVIPSDTLAVLVMHA